MNNMNGKIPANYFKPNNAENNNSSTNLKEQFERMVKTYIDSNPVIKSNNQTAELEIRFNATSRYADYKHFTNTETGRNEPYYSGKNITKIDYDNVIKQLYQLGFDTSNKSGNHLLRISNEYTDPKTGHNTISNVRAELAGLDLIQEYCKTNSIQKVLDLPSTASANRDKIKFTRKTMAVDKSTNTRILPVDFIDYGFRVSYQMEEDFAPSYGLARDIISKWTDTKKIFRYLNRVRFSHPQYPIFADVSIIKESKKTKKSKGKKSVPIPTYTLEDGGVFTNDEKYDIELEFDNSKVGIGTEYDTPLKLLAIVRKTIRHVLSAFQKTNYPIPFSERETVQQMYLSLIHGNNIAPRQILPKDFIGPSSYTLQLSNIIDNSNKEVQVKENSEMKTPSIRNHMTVTDKADGERRMLFIASNGRVYMIDMNMNIIFTGYVINSNKPVGVKSFSKMTNSLIDGEFIKYNKQGEVINLFAGFFIKNLNCLSNSNKQRSVLFLMFVT